jgi:hypothetical protein
LGKSSTAGENSQENPKRKRVRLTHPGAASSAALKNDRDCPCSTSSAHEWPDKRASRPPYIRRAASKKVPPPHPRR